MKDGSIITVIILTIIIVILATLLLVSEARAEFFGHGEFGYNTTDDDYYAELEIGYRFHPGPLDFELYAGAEYLMIYTRDIFFSPYRGIYKAGSTLRYRYIYINFEHICIHAIHSSDSGFEHYFVDPCSRNRIGIGFEF